MEKRIRYNLKLNMAAIFQDGRHCGIQNAMSTFRVEIEIIVNALQNAANQVTGNTHNSGGQSLGRGSRCPCFTSVLMSALLTSG